MNLVLAMILYGLLIVYLAFGLALSVYCIQMTRWDKELTGNKIAKDESSIPKVSAIYSFFLLIIFLWPLALLTAAIVKSYKVEIPEES